MTPSPGSRWRGYARGLLYSIPALARRRTKEGRAGADYRRSRPPAPDERVPGCAKPPTPPGSSECLATPRSTSSMERTADAGRGAVVRPVAGLRSAVFSVVARRIIRDIALTYHASQRSRRRCGCLCQTRRRCRSPFAAAVLFTSLAGRRWCRFARPRRRSRRATSAQTCSAVPVVRFAATGPGSRWPARG